MGFNRVELPHPNRPKKLTALWQKYKFILNTVFNGNKIGLSAVSDSFLRMKTSMLYET
jgi:hypothetical protein